MLTEGLLIAALAWGAFAFGGVYPWAYWPLAGVLVATAGLAFATMRSSAPSRDLRLMGGACGVFALAACVQLLAVPVEFLPSLSAYSLDVIGQLDLAVAAGAIDRHTISVAPVRTVRGVALFVAFTLVLLASARMFSVRGPRRLAEALTLMGAALALTAIVQKPLFAGQIYGFWTPESGREPFGPFVNKNHFAGWMLMTLPLTLGLMCAGIARAMEGVRPTWRDRVLWFSSADASRIILMAAAAAIMALSLVMTMSRSGIAALVVALTATSLTALKRQRTNVQKTVSFSSVAVLAIAVFAWVGVDAIVTRFASADWGEFNKRRGAWADAVDIARRFPIAGTGLNTYGVATQFYQRHDVTRYYGEAHNDYLQLAAEGGALLVMPAAACVVILIAVIRRRFRQETGVTSYWLRVGAVTGLGAIAIQETVEFSLQMPGNAALFAVMCGIAVHQTPRRDSARANHHASVPEVQVR